MTGRFRGVAEQVLDALLDEDPEWALDLGDPRGADRLTDRSEEADVRRVGLLTDALGSLDDIDDDVLPPGDRVDLEVLRARIGSELWHTTELRPLSCNPLEYSPGEAVYALAARDGLPTADRLAALAARCSALPEHLAVARERLGSGPGMSRIHAETALARLEGARTLLTDDVPALAAREPDAAPEDLENALEAALTAVEEYGQWLSGRLEHSTADPRLGERVYAARLWYTLDSELSPEALLVRAESDLIATEEALAEAASGYLGRPPAAGLAAEALSRVAAENACGPDDVRTFCEGALAHLDGRVRELDLVTVHDDPVRVIPMPRARRGIAVAYCDPPGPLAPGAGREAALIAVSPPPGDWPAARRESFFREYNAGMLRDLMVHEAMPGHALQLSHASRHRSGTRVGRVLRSGPFTEGWAVYAEELMADRGWSDDPAENAVLRLMQLKMRLRIILNAIVDVRLHTGDLSEAEAMALLVGRGHQEEGEAAGKWRRALLTSAQLSTYYVGGTEVADIARDLAAAHPGRSDRERHDMMLAHGSPPPRHLRTLLGL